MDWKHQRTARQKHCQEAQCSGGGADLYRTIARQDTHSHVCNDLPTCIKQCAVALNALACKCCIVCCRQNMAWFTGRLQLTHNGGWRRRMGGDGMGVGQCGFISITIWCNHGRNLHKMECTGGTALGVSDAPVRYMQLSYLLHGQCAHHPWLQDLFSKV